MKLIADLSKYILKAKRFYSHPDTMGARLKYSSYELGQ
ncbi:hypothetical protein PTUN_a2988 [Pseudoalteromonas tunicata]|nr:hypothetical protein PTUN_a2988 [Pseudoalteromonas tunicata]